MADDRNVQILKSVLPFLKDSFRDTVKMYIRLYEIQKTMERLDQEEEELFSSEQAQNDSSVYDMYQALRSYCSPKEAEFFDMFLNISQMARFYHDYENSDTTE